MPGPLPIELRERVVAAYSRGGKTLEDVASTFDVGTATIKRWRVRLRDRGSLEADQTGKAPPRKVTPDNLRVLLEERPDATLAELANTYSGRFGILVSTGSISRALKRAGITRKKRRSTPRNGTPSG